MTAPLIVFYGTDARAMALVALGLAMGSARLGWHVVLIDGDPEHGSLTQMLGHGNPGFGAAPADPARLAGAGRNDDRPGQSSFLHLLGGHATQPVALSATQGFAPRPGLWWLPARGLVGPQPAPRDRHKAAELGAALRAGLEALRCGDHPPEVLIACAPVGTSLLGLLLGDVAQVVVVYGDPAGEDPVGVFVDSFCRGRDPAPVRRDIHLEAAAPHTTDGVWVDTDGVFRGQLARPARVQQDPGWTALAADLLGALELPPVPSAARFRRLALAGELEGCAQAFAEVWADDRAAALALFHEVCSRRGGPLVAAVGAIRAIERCGDEVPAELLKLTVQRLRLSQPSALAKELFGRLAKRVGWREDREPDAQQELLAATATAAVHWAHHERSRGRDPSPALAQARRLLDGVLGRAEGPQMALVVAAIAGDVARVSGTTDLLPLARRALALAEPQLPEATARWGVQVIGRFALLNPSPEMLAELHLWAERLLPLDPGPAHYWTAVAYTHQGLREQAWASLRSAALHAEDALIRAAQDPQLAPLRAGFGSLGYFHTLSDPPPDEEPL